MAKNSRIYMLLAFIPAVALLSGCGGPLRLNYAPTVDTPQAGLERPLSIRIGSFRDARKTADGDPAVIGTINSTVLNMSGKKLTLAESPPALVRDAFIKEFSAAGYTVVTGSGRAQYSLDGEVRDFRLDIGPRDEISIEVFTEIKDGETGRVVWSGTAKEEGSRYAGVMGNSRGSISKYITAALSKAVRKTIADASPGLTGATVPAGPAERGTKQMEGASGGLRITSEPARAKVYLNGVYYGLTPLDLELAPGIYDLVIRKKGFIDATERVAVGRGRTTEFESTLEGEGIKKTAP